MKKRVYLIAAVVSGALAVLAAQLTLTPANAKQVNLLSGRSGLSRWRGYWCALFFEERRGKGALIGAAAGAALGGGVGITWMCRKRSCVTKCVALVLGNPQRG